MKAGWIAAVAWALGACSPPAATTTQVEAAAPNVCAASVDAQWSRPGSAMLSVNAATRGANCAEALATLTIRGPDGAPLYFETYPTAQVMVLAPAQSPAAMQAALAEWLDQSNPMIKTSDDLPVWKATDEMPASGEFPFYVAEGMGREQYNALRRRNVAVFCFVQGMESETCLALENNRLTKIGAQSFPG